MIRVGKLSGSGPQQVSFIFVGQPGHQVFLTGSFNDWDPAAHEMIYSGVAGGYVTELELPAGSYEYKFIVDGNWMADPDNPNFSANDFGTLNSVLNIG